MSDYAILHKSPGAHSKQIALGFIGSSPKIESQGNLILANKRVEADFHKSVVYQMAGDTRERVRKLISSSAIREIPSPSAKNLRA